MLMQVDRVREEVTMDSIVIELASCLNRFRSLTDAESRWLEASIRREERRKGNKREFWDRSLDSRLRRYLRRGKKVREIAPLIGKSEGAIWSRIRVLRGNRGHRRKPEQGFVEEQMAAE